MGWINKGKQATESHEDRQGTEILLDETYRPWRLVVTHKTGESSLGIWGADRSGRDALIYNGACSDDQTIPVGMEYRNVHIAVNFVPDDPPVVERWQVLGQAYRQSLRNARVEMETWVDH